MKYFLTLIVLVSMNCNAFYKNNEIIVDEYTKKSMADCKDDIPKAFFKKMDQFKKCVKDEDLNCMMKNIGKNVWPYVAKRLVFVLRHIAREKKKINGKYPDYIKFENRRFKVTKKGLEKDYLIDFLKIYIDKTILNYCSYKGDWNRYDLILLPDVTGEMEEIGLYIHKKTGDFLFFGVREEYDEKGKRKSFHQIFKEINKEGQYAEDTDVKK